jgi:hypothetical protein
MSELQVTYEPNPIPWIIHHNHLGQQTGPGKAEVTLTVSAVDASTGEPVAGNVVYNPSSDSTIDDPNYLSMQTNTPQQVRLSQLTSHEVPEGQPLLYFSPEVQVVVDGYEPVSLSLD